MNSIDTRPTEGWEDREDGRKTFVSHDVWCPAPAAPEGFQVYWIARHTDHVRYIYKAVA